MGACRASGPSPAVCSSRPAVGTEFLVAAARACPDWACWDSRGSPPAMSGGGRRRVRRCHDDVSPHSQDEVSDINVGEGARSGECQREAAGPAGLSRGEKAGVEEARPVVASVVRGGGAEEPLGEDGKGLPGEECHAMLLIAGVVGPDNGVADVDVHVLRQVSPICSTTQRDASLDEARRRPSTRCCVAGLEVAVVPTPSRCCGQTRRLPLARSSLTERAPCGMTERSQRAASPVTWESCRPAVVSPGAGSAR